MSPVEIVMAALEEQGCRPKRHAKGGASALCPAHADTRPSLTLDVGDDERALVHCFAGCPPEAILNALGLKMADLFPLRGVRCGDNLRRPARRQPVGAQDETYSITPRFLTESGDPYCAQLYNYLDLRQGTRGRFARGDQAIADALGWQARTVRSHAEHLAGAGWIRIHKQPTESGAHKATEYEVVHNPARKRTNTNATTPLRKGRARPRSRLAANGETSSGRRSVARGAHPHPQ
jgi:hypothetical protein